ncbi:lymphotoxin-alpha-like [Pempheris klunzingeri]|uniref:lymphotoxin-alpha-like n=1 Tax=Pempheris klunzingeri TaxID=3127111 RepID=UPI00397EC2D6
MEMWDGNRRLIRDWETSGGMEGDRCCRCCCGGEAGAQEPDTSVQLLRRRQTRLRRTTQLFAVALLLLASGTLVLLVAVVRGQRSPDKQSPEQPSSHSAGLISEHQLKTDYPVAMLTVPCHNTTGEYLEWESKIGFSFCHGGFNYTSGSLVVPRDGVYRVFLQITYESKKGLMPECHNNNGQLMLTNKVFYFRDTYRANTHLLSSVDTVNCSMKPWRKSIYTSGLFFLEAKSKLRVKSLHPKLIAGNEHEVFFGAQLLLQQPGERIT